MKKIQIPNNLHPLLVHGLVLVTYLLLTLVITWPMALNFDSALVGGSDYRLLLWTMWYTKYAILEGQPLYYTQLLYYPVGVSLLTHGLGPLLGAVALPLWLWGPEVVYNGTILIGSVVTGYSMYLLARSQGFNRSVSFFAGVLLLMAPIRLAAVYGGHLAEVFIALPVLVLWSLLQGLNPLKSAWWAVVASFIWLLTILHVGEQFVFAGLGVGFWLVVSVIFTRQRGPVLKRAGIFLTSGVVLTAPFLVAIWRASNSLGIEVKRNLESLQHHPDLVQFFVPTELNRFLGPFFTEILRPVIVSPVETAVFLVWTGLVLCLVALISRNRRAWLWIAFTAFCALISLGPFLRVWGRSNATDFELPIILPFAVLTSLPGLDFWRTPGRFMAIGYIGLGISASFGLAWLQSKAPLLWRGWLPWLAVGLVLVETWPMPFDAYQEKLRPVPAFYRQIAADADFYGVFDLPVRPFRDINYDSWYINNSSYYQMYQMTHQKGIAVGYVSRFYAEHPLFAQFLSNSVSDSPWQPNILLNGQPANRYANARHELVKNGYRYVVFHKPQADYRGYTPGGWGEQAAQQFIAQTFGDQPALVDDALTQVFEVGPPGNEAELTTTIALRENSNSAWYEYLEGEQIAISPVTFYVASPRSQPVELQVSARQMVNAATGQVVEQGRLSLQTGDSVVEAALRMGNVATLPFLLVAGSRVITLTAQSLPGAGSADAPAPLNFVIDKINLNTLPGD
ncbi:MAG: hypothetical protein Kow0031_08100 [Anaerolineae bacterium]